MAAIEVARYGWLCTHPFFPTGASAGGASGAIGYWWPGGHMHSIPCCKRRGCYNAHVIKTFSATFLIVSVLFVLVLPLFAHAFPFGGAIGTIVPCYNNAIYASLGPPAAGRTFGRRRRAHTIRPAAPQRPMAPRPRQRAVLLCRLDFPRHRLARDTHRHDGVQPVGKECLRTLSSGLDGRRHVSRVRETAEAWSEKFSSDGEKIICDGVSRKRARGALFHCLDGRSGTRASRCGCERGLRKIRPTGRILCVAVRRTGRIKISVTEAVIKLDSPQSVSNRQDSNPPPALSHQLRPREAPSPFSPNTFSKFPASCF